MWTVSDPALAAWMDDSLTAVDTLLRSTLDSPDDPFLTDVATHLLNAGGKRLRPALALLASRSGHPGRPGVIRAAAAVELMHVASLYHDDVMDEAPTRRGVASVNTLWGNRVAILAGDYLVAKAAQLVAPLGTAATDEQARMLARLVAGQLHETEGADRGSDHERHYMTVIADKTAALFTLSTRLGAHASGAPPEAIEALGAYGESLGVAFQLSDDILDLSNGGPSPRKGRAADRSGGAAGPSRRAAEADGRNGDTAGTGGQSGGAAGTGGRSGSTAQAGGQSGDVTGAGGRSGGAAGSSRRVGRLASPAGKPPNADLRQGLATLPVLRATRGRDRMSARLRRMLSSRPLTGEDDLATAARLLRRSPGYAESVAEVRRHAGRAAEAVRALPASPARDALLSVCDHVVARVDPQGTRAPDGIAPRA
ncbi:polyprenyl synthetase family protein [Sphaerisporangium sp. TRM90804]|uniref:polyprenyl synthetase family protein n=1 Tax=Sphaerisporangium sp. TRM90804 TaxID=3031113 RepID=UPI0024483BE6|nr:polyprenyl synthetase family protein [Sphaerisporangium sp. TRM90804]MDH2427131.1 polyprenyl synthetase family protein [Sphaerisporangium sp. TRM90804]